jgi:hypothetical protein
VPKHLGGKKFTNTHTTVSDQGEIVAKASAKMPEVRRVKLGRITHAPGGKFRIKCMVINGSLLKVVVRGNTSIQELHLDCDNAERVKSKLEAQFPTR